MLASICAYYSAPLLSPNFYLTGRATRNTTPRALTQGSISLKTQVPRLSLFTIGSSPIQHGRHLPSIGEAKSHFRRTTDRRTVPILRNDNLSAPCPQLHFKDGKSCKAGPDVYKARRILTVSFFCFWESFEFFSRIAHIWL